MTGFTGIFEVLAADQHDVRLASRRALILSRDRIDARLGRFLSAAGGDADFAARYSLVEDDFAGIVRIAADEVGHDDPEGLIETLRDHYAKDWIQKAVKKPGDLHKKLHVPEGENIPEEKIENAEESGDKNLKEKAQFAENVKGLGKKKKSKKNKKKDKKPPWLQDDGDDDGDDDSLNFAAKTDDVVPLVRTADDNYDEDDEGSMSEEEEEAELHKEKDLPWGSGGRGPEKDEDEWKKKKSKNVEGEDSFEFAAKTAGSVPLVRMADEGNTGLAGPSPKMDKKRWTPKSVKPIDVPSERHPTVQKDITEVMPKDNEGPPGDIKNIDEISAQLTTETLPTATNDSDAGFADNNQDMAPHTKTFGDGGQVDPVKSESLAA